MRQEFIVYDKNNDLEKYISKLDIDSIVYLFDSIKEIKKFEKSNFKKELCNKIEIKLAAINDLKKLQGIDKKYLRIYKGNEYMKASRSKFIDIILFDYKKEDNIRLLNLNHVICNQMKEKGIKYALPTRFLLDDRIRKKVLKTIINNIKVCEKFKIEFIIAAFSKDKEDLRDVFGIEAIKEFLNKKKI
jgi:RNase P/RNase MRP subunit p30